MFPYVINALSQLRCSNQKECCIVYRTEKKRISAALSLNGWMNEWMCLCKTLTKWMCWRQRVFQHICHTGDNLSAPESFSAVLIYALHSTQLSLAARACLREITGKVKANPCVLLMRQNYKNQCYSCPDMTLVIRMN